MQEWIEALDTVIGYAQHKAGGEQEEDGLEAAIVQARMQMANTIDI